MAAPGVRVRRTRRAAAAGRQARAELRGPAAPHTPASAAARPAGRGSRRRKADGDGQSGLRPIGTPGRRAPEARRVSDLATLTAIEQAQLIRDRKASPVEVVQAVLDRIEAWQPHLNAFAALDAERAMAAARAAEAQPAAGPLHGVPVTIKDVQAVAGLPSGAARASPPIHRPPRTRRWSRGSMGRWHRARQDHRTEQCCTAVTAARHRHTHNPWMHGAPPAAPPPRRGAGRAGCGGCSRHGRGGLFPPAGAFRAAVGHKRPRPGPLCPVPNNIPSHQAWPITAARPCRA